MVISAYFQISFHGNWTESECLLLRVFKMNKNEIIFPFILEIYLKNF